MKLFPRLFRKAPPPPAPVAPPTPVEPAPPVVEPAEHARLVQLIADGSLDPAELASLHSLAVDVGLDVMVEIHDERELEHALAADATAWLINSLSVPQRNRFNDELASLAAEFREISGTGGAVPADRCAPVVEC